MHFLHFSLFFAFIWAIDATSNLVQRENKDENCYNATSMEGIDFIRFLNRTWIERERSPNFYEKCCGGIDYDVLDNNFRIKFVEDDLSGVGKFDDTSASITLNDTTYLYNIVITDYENYAVVYACNISLHNEITEMVWVLSGSNKLTNSTTLLADHERLKDLLKNDECKNQILPTESSTEISDATEPPSAVNSTTTNLNTTLPQFTTTEPASTAGSSSPTTSINTPSPSETTDNNPSPPEPTVNTSSPSEPTENTPDSESTTLVPGESTTLPPLIPAFYVNGKRVFFLSQLFV